MKTLLAAALVLGSTLAISACSGNGTSEYDLDGSMTGAPYAEERTVGKNKAPVRRAVRSAQPVFERSQVK